MSPVAGRAGIYARISSDREADGLAIGRQLEDCERVAVERGWQVYERYVDQDVSAYKARVRPAYRRMLSDLRSGTIDGVIVYHLDRLHRLPSELEEFFDVCRDAGVDDLASVTGRIDLADPDGQFQARILGAVAKKESDDKSRRIRRKNDERAAAGKVPGGGSARLRVRGGSSARCPREAAVVREAATRFLAGESIRSICSGLNERGDADLDGEAVDAADVAANARRAADQRPAQPPRRDRWSGRVAGDHHAGRERADPRAACRPEPAHEQDAPAGTCFAAYCAAAAVVRR